MQRILFLTALAFFVFGNVQAQKKKKVTKSVTVEEKISPTDPQKRVVTIHKDINGEKTVEEIIIDADSPRTKVYQFSDTLIDGEKELKYGDGFTWKESFPRSMFKEGSPSKYRYRFSYPDFEEKINDLDRQFRTFRFNGAGFEKDGFSEVSVYTNKPATNVLNISFKSNNEGAVNITVLNLQGEQVAKESISDFSGEYLGQMKLPEGVAGTYFILISHGENGISRKVKIE